MPLQQLDLFKEIIASQTPDSSWATHEAMMETLEEMSGLLEHDIAELNNNATYVFSEDCDVESHTRQCVDLFRVWHDADHNPSLAAICVFAVENLGLTVDGSEWVVPAVMMAGILAEVPNSLPYHNNMHYRNVTFLVISLIVRHNKIYAGTREVLPPDQIALLIIAACIHDLGHNGRGNTDGEGIHQPSRTEKHSFELAQPYLAAAGIDDEVTLADIGTLLICTDTTPLNDPNNSPVSQMKQVYRYHFRGGKDQGVDPIVRSDLKLLKKRPRLTMMALLLHEADIGISAGLDYNLTKYETQLYRDEIGPDEARPHHVVDFLDKICQKRMLSEAGKLLFADNLKAIYERAEEGINEGDLPYKRPEESDFLKNVQAQ